MFTGYCNSFYYCANKMPLITSQTSPREFTLKRHCSMMGLPSSPQHCIRFPCSKETFSHYILSREVFSVITRTIEVFPSLIFSYYTQICCCYIELFSHQICSGYTVFFHHDPRMPGYCNMEKRLQSNGKEINSSDGKGRTHG